MAYTLQTFKSGFKGGKNILASEHFQFIEAGATLNAAAIGNTYLPVGTPVARNTTNGKYEVFSSTTGFDNFGLLNIDVNVDGQNDVVVGEVIVRGSVYEAKLPASVNTAFKTATKEQIRYVKHI